MILISKTFEEWTPESVEDCCNTDSGFVYDAAPFTFRELVQELRNYSEPSQSRGCDDRTWFSTEGGVTDYRTLTQRRESLHYSHENPPRNIKYWQKAARYVGLVK